MQHPFDGRLRSGQLRPIRVRVFGGGAVSGLDVRSATLLLATFTVGLAAGVFALYAHTVLPGLRRTDDRTFVAAFQAIDRAIINVWFVGGTFLGALGSTAAAAFANRRTPAMPWITVALIGYALAVVITFVVHVPRNNAVKAAGDPVVIDVAAVRAAFDETGWVAWNVVRTVSATVAFACLARALLLAG